LKRGGRLLFQMGGKGNAQEILAVLDRLFMEKPWMKFFVGFSFPHGFYTPDQYTAWLREVKLEPERVELVPKNMQLQGREGLAGWIRTTWLPYTERLPTELREQFIEQIVTTYLNQHPLDGAGVAHVRMVRLEVEANKPA
jgi:trans-aconitate methyltransferase